MIPDIRTRYEIAESRLAAAIALLRELPQPGTYISRELRDAIETFLAGQPAAPTFVNGRCSWCGTRQPTNFADGDGCTDCGKSGQPAAPTRTESEQAVLDAMDKAPEDWIRWWAQTGGGSGPAGWMRGVGEAMLARRGLKP